MDLPSQLDAAKKLDGKKSAAAYEALLPRIRAAKDPVLLGRALNELALVHLNLGDNDAVFKYAGEAVEISKASNQPDRQARVVNLIGLAHLARAEYPDSRLAFQQAVDLFRKAGNDEQLVYVHNNIASIFYYEGRYVEALRAYQEAEDLVRRHAGKTWSAEANQFTSANLAMLFQRLGRDDAALAVYRNLQREARLLDPAEEATSLLNLGALYRRLGDPVKAVETYEKALKLFQQARNAQGEIRVLRNIGIAEALDFANYSAALKTFQKVQYLADFGGRKRDSMHARLYLGETHFRDGFDDRAEVFFQQTLRMARDMGTAEEQWKALYGLGRIAERRADIPGAIGRLRDAVSIIESVRSRIQLSSLRPEFLADKRDVYDSLIGLLLASTEERLDATLLEVLERVRGRSLQDVMRGRPEDLQPALKKIRSQLAETYSARQRARGAEVAKADAEAARLEAEYLKLEPSVPGLPAQVSSAALRQKLPEGTALLSYWQGPLQVGYVWVTAKDGGYVVRPFNGDDRAKLKQYLADLSTPSSVNFEAAGAELAELLLGFPWKEKISRLIIVPDGSLSTLPFEVLPYEGKPLIESYDVTYLPAAALLLRPQAEQRAAMPWNTQFSGFADPLAVVAPGRDQLLPQDSHWLALPRALDEATTIARFLPGRSRVLVGAQATKKALLTTQGVPILHLATHAAADEEAPERSRILLAGDTAGNRLDYFFLFETPLLNLSGVDLVTLSACETEKGRMVRGDGIQSFGRALLGAGATATVTTLWPVSDQAAGELMKQFYFALSKGMGKSEALRAAKLKFIHSSNALRHPSQWAAFVMNGDGSRPLPPVLSWAVFSITLAAAVVTGGFLGAFLLARTKMAPDRLVTRTAQ